MKATKPWSPKISGQGGRRALVPPWLQHSPGSPLSAALAVGSAAGSRSHQTVHTRLHRHLEGVGMKSQGHGEGCPPAQPTLPETNPGYRTVQGPAGPEHAPRLNPEQLQPLSPTSGVLALHPGLPSGTPDWPNPTPSFTPSPSTWAPAWPLGLLLSSGKAQPPHLARCQPGPSPPLSAPRLALTVPAGPFDEAGGRLELEGVQVAVPAERGRE